MGFSRDLPLAGMFQGFISLSFGDGPDEVDIILIAKEITKIHENHFRGTAKEMHQIFSSTPIKGEFVVVIEKNKNN